MGTRLLVTPEQAQLGRGEAGKSPTDMRNEFWDRMGGGAQQSSYDGYDYAANQTGANAQQGRENQGLSDQFASQAGGHLTGAIGLAGSMARGTQPSAAAMQLQSGLNQGMAQQSAMARGARGSAAMAVADSNRMGNQAALRQQAYGQGQVLRAQEMASGRGMLGSLLGQQQDLAQNRLGQNTQLQQQNSQMRDGYELGIQNAAVGIGGSLVGSQNQDQGLFKAGMRPIDAQSEADQAHQTWRAKNRSQAVAANLEDT